MNSYFALTFLLIACLTSNSDARRSREREIVRLSELIKFSYRFDLLEREADRVETRTRHRITEHELRRVDPDHIPGDHDTYTQEYDEVYTVTEIEGHTEFYTEEYVVTESEYFTMTETEIFTETETEPVQICTNLSKEVDQECFQGDICPTKSSPSCCSVLTDFTAENCTENTALTCPQHTTLSAFFKQNCAITVDMTMQLPIAKADFNGDAQTAFVDTVSHQTSVSTKDVKIASITETPQKQGGISVVTQITVANANQASSCQSSLSDVTAFVSVLNSNFASLGVSITVDASQVHVTIVTNNPSNPSPTSTRSPTSSMSPSPTSSATASLSHSATASTTASLSVGVTPSATSSNLPTTSPSSTMSVSATTTATVSPSSTAEPSPSSSSSISTSSSSSSMPSQTASVSAVAQSPSATISPSPTHAIIHVSSASRSAVTVVTVVLAMIVATFI